MGGFGAVLRTGIVATLAACAHTAGPGREPRAPQSHVHRAESAADDGRVAPPPSAAVSLKLTGAFEPRERAVPKCGVNDDRARKR